MSPSRTITEEIVWHRADIAMPDSDETVLVRIDDEEEEPVWLGYHDGDRWLNVDGYPINAVICWAKMPEGPVML
ncbi:hypothetical protein [Propionivibrio limicola]|uniref:hypothetical protein n=1 Tax=Propionivibrio limicola TaxID=167645 RepID=UPI001292AB4B|nr:hypothetical protein [Propionivibrio limicola]